MAKSEIPVEVKFDDFKAVIEEIKNLQTYKLSEDDDMVLVDRGKVAYVLANHVEAFLLDKPYCDEPPKTNADRIRAMSDEELAHFIWNRDIDIVGKASVAGQFTFTVDREKCFKNVLDWLKKEVKE